MTYFRWKEIPPGSGNRYVYEVHSERAGDSVSQIHDSYIGTYSEYGHLTKLKSAESRKAASKKLERDRRAAQRQIDSLVLKAGVRKLIRGTDAALDDTDKSNALLAQERARRIAESREAERQALQSHRPGKRRKAGKDRPIRQPAGRKPYPIPGVNAPHRIAREYHRELVEKGVPRKVRMETICRIYPTVKPGTLRQWERRHTARSEE